MHFLMICTVIHWFEYVSWYRDVQLFVCLVSCLSYQLSLNYLSIVTVDVSRVAVWLVLPTFDQGIMGLNPFGGKNFQFG